MKVIISKHIPFHGYVAMMLFGTIIWRKEYENLMNRESYYKRTVNHESIHEAQMLDFTSTKLPRCIRIVFGGLLFYICYGCEWLVRLFINGPMNAYRNLSFEQEAYNNEYDYEYLDNRKKFAEWKKNK